MKTKIIATITFFIASVSLSYAQDCKAFLPYKEGTKTITATYDKKDKKTNITTLEILKVEHIGSKSTFGVKQTITDEKGKDPFESELEFRCENGIFYIDMSTMISQDQLEAYKDMEMEMDMSSLEIPNDPKPDQTLKDATLTVNIISESPIDLGFSILIKNRKIDAIEEITTPAGSFNCVKLSQDVETQSIISFTFNTITWYAEGVGAVRTETYKKGKLVNYTILEKIE